MTCVQHDSDLDAELGSAAFQKHLNMHQRIAEGANAGSMYPIVQRLAAYGKCCSLALNGPCGCNACHASWSIGCINDFVSMSSYSTQHPFFRSPASLS